MREPLVIRPQESAIGNVFDEALKGYQAHPGYEASYKGMLAAAIKQKLLQAQQSQQAQLNQQSALAKIFSQHMGEDPNAPTAAELTAAAMVGPGTTKDMGDQFRNAYQTALTTGNSDAMRRSMVMGGHSIDQNFAPTGADAAAIQNRNAWNVPLSEGQVKGSYLQAMEPFLSPRQKLNIVAPGGTNMSLSPTGGLSISSSPNGNAMPGEYGALPPGTSMMPKVQDSTLALRDDTAMKAQQAMDVLRIYETVSKAMDPTKFGLSGDVQEHAGHWVNQIQQVAGAAGLPVDQFNKKLTDTLAKAGAAPGIAQGLISGNMDINKLSGLQAAALSQVTQVLNGFSERPPNEYIIKMANELLPQPFGPGGSQALNQQGIDTAKTLTQAVINRMAPQPEPVYATPTQANMAPVPNAPVQNQVPLTNHPSAVPTAPVPTGPMSAPVATNAPDGGSSVTVAQPIATLSQPTAPVPSAPVPPIDAPIGPVQVKSRADVMGLNEGQQFMAPGSTKIFTVPKKVGNPDDLAKVPAGSPYLDMTDGSVKYKPNANAMDPNGAPPAGSVPVPQGSYE